MQLIDPGRTNLTSLFTFAVELFGQSREIKESDCVERGLNDSPIIRASSSCTTSIEGEKCFLSFHSPKLHKTFFQENIWR